MLHTIADRKPVIRRGASHDVLAHRPMQPTRGTDPRERPAARADEVPGWFSLDPRENGCAERPDELACLSLTATDDSAVRAVADGGQERWM
jgi:hypothetical protein